MEETGVTPAVPVWSRGLGVVVLVLVGLAGCRHVPPEVAAPMPSAADPAVAAKLETGRAIYLSSGQCARCHSAKPVYEHTPQEWREKILPGMAKKAKLNQTEYDAVLAYVTSPAAQTPPPPAPR